VECQRVRSRPRHREDISKVGIGIGQLAARERDPVPCRAEGSSRVPHRGEEVSQGVVLPRRVRDGLADGARPCVIAEQGPRQNVFDSRAQAGWA
jgi:hypothetical protein